MDVLRDFEMGNLALAELANLCFGAVLPSAKTHSREDDFSQALIGQTDDLNFCDLGTGIKEFFDLARI